MPTELQIIRAADFIRLGPHGSIDLEASRRYLSELARACRRRGLSRALVDIRGIIPKAKPTFSPTDLASLVDRFEEMGFCESDRLAVLYSQDPHHRARMFALIGTLQGWHVKAFNDFESAIAWLSEGAEHEERVQMSKHGEKITHRPPKRPKRKTRREAMKPGRGVLLRTKGLERSRKEPSRA